MEKLFKGLKKEDIIAVFCLLVIIFLFHYEYIFLYMPLQEGWHHMLANKILDGYLPYKDFHLMLPPVFPYICAGVLKTFGDSIITLRIYGLIERMILFIPIYFMVRRLSSAKIAFLATSVGAIYYTSTNADFINTFYQTTILFGVFSLFFVIKAFETEKQSEFIKCFVYLFLSGMFCSMSVLTKQSTGVFVFAAIASILFAQMIINKSFNLKKCFVFLLGLLLPIVCLIVYLKANNLQEYFVNSVFSGALNSKGASLNAILFGFLERFKNSQFFVPLLIVIVMFLYSHFSYKKTKNIWSIQVPITLNMSEKNIIFLSSLLIVSIILFTGFCVKSFINLKVSFLNFSFGYFCNFLFLVCLLSIINYFIKFLKNKSLNSEQELFLYFYIFSFFTLYAHGLSWQLEPHGMFLVLPVFVVFLLNYGLPFDKEKNILIYVLSFVLIFVCCGYKYSNPLSWWGDTSQSVHYSKFSIKNEKAKHLLVSNSRASRYNEILSLIDNVCGENDKIYTFPTIVAINYLSGKKSDTFTTFPYFDTYPDWLATNDAITLLNNPPKVIVYQDYGHMIRVHELMFRQGHLSGQSNIIFAIRKLVRDKKLKYKLYKKYPSDKYLDFPIYVFYRLT